MQITMTPVMNHVLSLLGNESSSVEIVSPTVLL